MQPSVFRTTNYKVIESDKIRDTVLEVEGRKYGVRIPNRLLPLENTEICILGPNYHLGIPDVDDPDTSGICKLLSVMPRKVRQGVFLLGSRNGAYIEKSYISLTIRKPCKIGMKKIFIAVTRKYIDDVTFCNHVSNEYIVHSSSRMNEFFRGIWSDSPMNTLTGSVLFSMRYGGDCILLDECTNQPDKYYHISPTLNSVDFCVESYYKREHPLLFSDHISVDDPRYFHMASHIDDLAKKMFSILKCNRHLIVYFEFPMTSVHTSDNYRDYTEPLLYNLKIECYANIYNDCGVPVVEDVIKELGASHIESFALTNDLQLSGLNNIVDQ